MLEDGAVLGELFEDIRGSSGGKSKHSDPTVVVVILTGQLLPAGINTKVHMSRSCMRVAFVTIIATKAAHSDRHTLEGRVKLATLPTAHVNTS